MKFRITKPRPDDSEELTHLFSTTIWHTFKDEGIAISHDSDLEKEIACQTGALQRCFDSRGRDEYFLIASDKHRIVGTIAFGPANENIRKNLDINFDKCPEIKAAYVLPDYQGQGIGSLLFKEIIVTLGNRGFDEFCLDCGYRNAQLFWKRKIGDPLVILRNYFGQNAHFMIWRRNIDHIMISDD